MEEFSELLQSDWVAIEPVLNFFDGLERDEARLRWDRLVAFHLLILAFINSFGYKRQHSSYEMFVQAAKQMKNTRILENLVMWLPRHDLERDGEANKIVRAAKEVARYAPNNLAIYGG